MILEISSNYCRYKLAKEYLLTPPRAQPAVHTAAAPRHTCAELMFLHRKATQKYLQLSSKGENIFLKPLLEAQINRPNATYLNFRITSRFLILGKSYGEISLGSCASMFTRSFGEQASSFWQELLHEECKWGEATFESLQLQHCWVKEHLRI